MKVAEAAYVRWHRIPPTNSEGPAWLQLQKLFRGYKSNIYILNHVCIIIDSDLGCIEVTTLVLWEIAISEPL